MKNTKLTPKIYHKHLELDALSKSFIAKKEAEQAKKDLHKHLEMRSRILLCRHLYHYSENNFKEWDIAAFDIQAISGFRIIENYGKFKLTRAFKPSDFHETDLEGYMPYANPEDEYSWSVLFKVKDSNGDFVDRQIMESAPMLHEDNDLAKTEYESLLYNFERCLKSDLNSFSSLIDEKLASMQSSMGKINSELNYVNSEHNNKGDKASKGIKGLHEKYEHLLKVVNFSVIALGLMVLGALGLHAVHFNYWNVIGVF